MTEQVLLYDTTLRDGMQGQGMTLSAQEKVRVVRGLDIVRKIQRSPADGERLTPSIRIVKVARKPLGVSSS